MKRFWLFLLVFISFYQLEAATKKQKKMHQLAICAITRDDAPYLKEWVEFHLHQGVERIFIYDNLSKDHPELALKEHIEKGNVEIIKWDIDHKTRKEWLSCQNGAYLNCAKKIKNNFKWCAFIDTDEFLFCPTGQKIPTFLKQFDPYEQICVNWLIFGTSNIQKAQPGKLIQELLLRTTTDRHNDCKSIVQLKYAVDCQSPHFFFTKNMIMVNPNKERITIGDFTKKRPSIDKLRINHYLFRDLDFFHNIKLARIKQQGKGADHMIEMEKSFNQVRDESILKCLPKEI